MPESIYPIISKVCGVQKTLSTAIAERDISKIFTVFCEQVDLSKDNAKELFDKIIANTSEYLKEYKI